MRPFAMVLLILASSLSAYANSFRLDRFHLPEAISFDALVTALGGESNDGECTGDKKWVCKVMQRSIARDSNQCGIFHPDELFNRNGALADLMRSRGDQLVVGRHYFFGLAHMPYMYKLRFDEQGRIEIYIHVNLEYSSVRRLSPELYRHVIDTYDEAEQNWKAAAARYGLGFELEVTHEADVTGYQNLVVREGRGRGPAQIWVFTAWNTRVQTHEIGHFVGLDEEYPELNNERIPGDPAHLGGAGRDSMMRGGHTIYKTHFHIPLQRAMCAGRRHPNSPSHPTSFDGIF
jgi:hypothetical protein